MGARNGAQYRPQRIIINEWGASETSANYTGVSRVMTSAKSNGVTKSAKVVLVRR
jgi:hypothetical protein